MILDSKYTYYIKEESLNTKSLPEHEIKKLHDLVETWISLGKRKRTLFCQSLTGKNDLSEKEIKKICKDYDENPELKRIIYSIHICKLISFETLRSVNQNFGFTSWNELIVVEDQNKMTQAVGLYDNKCNYLYLLATHPNNLNITLNKEIPTKVKGAGSELILNLALRTLQQQNSLSLISVDDSRDFYIRLGFEQDLSYLIHKDFYGSDDEIESSEDHEKIKMQLTAKKITRMISYGHKPYHRIKKKEITDEASFDD